MFFCYDGATEVLWENAFGTWGFNQQTQSHIELRQGSNSNDIGGRQVF